MKILVVDDEKSILQLVKMNLELEGYAPLTAENGYSALEIIKNQKPNIIILDAMLPDIDGFSLIPRIKKIDDIPIIMLTAKSYINDKLLGLQLGADDYITKPFNSTELLLRIKSVSKRIPNKDEEEKNKITIGDLIILKQERKILVENNCIDATYKEFEVLSCLCEHKGKVFSREKLLSRVWGFEFEGTTRAVDILIQRLRKKLGNCQGYIKTIYGAGYKVDVE